MDQVLGGWSETKDATAEIQRICDQVKEPVEKKTGKKYEEFKAVQYREQIVAGTNYVIRVHVGGLKYLDVMVFQPLPCTGREAELLGVHENKTKDDPIKPFEK